MKIKINYEHKNIFYRISKNCTDTPFSSIAMRQINTPFNPPAQEFQTTVLAQSQDVATNASNQKSSASLSSVESLNSLSEQDIGMIGEILDDNLVLSNLDGFRRGGPQLRVKIK